MPVIFIEAPPGIGPQAKKTLMERITAAVDEAYHIGDTLIFCANIRPRTWRWTAACNPTIPKSLRP
jgi:hypothetical protein